MRRSNNRNAVVARILAGEFYRQHAGFFLLTFLLCFGVFDAAATIRLHRGLMQMMATRPAAMVVGVGGWALYFLKAALFAVRTLRAPACRFLCEAQALTGAQAWRMMGVPVAVMALPALAYNSVAAGVALQDGRPLAAVALALFPVAMIACVAVLALRVVRGMHRNGWAVAWSVPAFFSGRALSFGGLTLAYLLSGRRLLLLSTKVVSLLLIQGVVWVNADAAQREGTYFLALLLVAVHVALPYAVARFLEGNPWLRNAPLPPLLRHAQLCAVWLAVVLPDLVCLLIYRPPALGVGVAVGLYALLAAMLSVLHTAAYLRSGDMNRYLTVVMLALPVTMFLLTSVPVWALAAGWAVVGAGGFVWLYPRYERGAADG